MLIICSAIKNDAAYVADVIAAWATRYIGSQESQVNITAQPGTVVVAETGVGKFANAISIGGRHTLLADEPVDYGGTDTGPSPYDFLLAGLGACKSMTMRMYAERKGWPVDKVKVTLKHDKIHAQDCEMCETTDGRIDRIDVEIEVMGDMDEETRSKIAEIAKKCPVHKTLQSEIVIESHHKK